MIPLRKFGVEHLLGAAAIIAAPVAVYAPAGMTPIVGAAGIGAVLMLWQSGRLAELWRNRLALIFALLIAWGTLSAVWAVHADDSLTLARGLALLFIAILALIAAAGALDEAGRQRLGIMLAIALALGAVVLAIELASNAWLNRLFHDWRHGNSVVSGGVLDRGLILLVFFGFLTAIGLARRGWLLPGFAAMFPALLLSLFANSHSARIFAALSYGKNF